MDFSNFKKILIIRLSSLGDILLSTPLIRTLKNKYPNMQIDFIVRKEYLDTIKYNPNINKVISLKRDYNIGDIRKQIKNSDYDAIVDLQNNFRSRVLTYRNSKKVFRYKKPYLKRLLLVKFKVNMFNSIIPIPIRYANAINDFKLDDNGLELFLDSTQKAELDDNIEYIGLCPGSRHKTKMWPIDYYVNLGEELTKNNFIVVLFGGKDDKEICKNISDRITNSIDLSNDNHLLELAVNMKKCKAIICNDSGLMHTALAMNIPTIAIFGSTVKEFGFAPYKGKNLILENNSLSCRPCSHIGLDQCPKKHLNCLKDTDPKFVFSETLKFLNCI